MNLPPVPDFLPGLPEGTGNASDATELALELYRQLASARRDTETTAARANERIQAHIVSTGGTIGALAAERFEFDQLLRRVQPELLAIGADNVSRVLDLFARSWTATLAREEVEIRDLTGEPFTAELAEAVDVSSAAEDPAIAEPVVSETLVPLVLHRGRLIRKALVNKAVPVPPAAETEILS